MAKGNMLLGTLRGSIGDVTYSRTNGAQISKAKSTSPRNPRTSKQIYQRMFFATIAKAKSAMKNIVDHSFEQVAHGSKSLQYFSKRNIALMRQTAVFSDSLQTWVAPGMGFVPPKANSFTWNPYRISEGSLPKLNVPNWPDLLPEQAKFDLTSCVPWFTNVPESMGENPDYFNMLNGMLEQAGVKVGDYMTVCLISAKKDDIAQGAGIFYNCNFHYIRFKVIDFLKNDQHLKAIVPSNVDGVNYTFPVYFGHDPASADLPYLDDECLNLFYHYNDEGKSKALPILGLGSGALLEVVYTKLEGGSEVNYIYNFDLPIREKEDVILAATWIHSRPVSSSKLLVSTQDMILADQSGDVYEYNLGLIDAYDEWNELVKQVGDDTYILRGGNASAGA